MSLPVVNLVTVGRRQPLRRQSSAVTLGHSGLWQKNDQKGKIEKNIKTPCLTKNFSEKLLKKMETVGSITFTHTETLAYAPHFPTKEIHKNAVHSTFSWQNLLAEQEREEAMQDLLSINGKSFQAKQI